MKKRNFLRAAALAGVSGAALTGVSALAGVTLPGLTRAGNAESLCLYGAYGLKRPAALNGPQFLVGDVLKTPLRIEGGIAHVPEGPGLGIEVDENKVIALMKESGGDRLLEP
jgi:L-alanine-DL-glutamate epimerase-like enolase superfamily enzyme